LPVENYWPGDKYAQAAKEIHVSKYIDGTVTLNERRIVGDGEHARVFWESGDWVDAEPRAATEDEVDGVLRQALRKWDTWASTES
jgi:hypothetical protein